MRLLLRSSTGLTLLEVMVAVVVLGVGIAALAGSFALVTRMVARGRVQGRATQLAASRVEQLRLRAASTTPRCGSTGFAGGGPLTTGAVTEQWEVGAGGASRVVRVIVSYPVSGGTHTDTLQTRIDC
jgi:prepilin-type N-terminal cleavage/methylation domain-containing protein